MFLKKKKLKKRRELYKGINFVIKQISSVPLLKNYNFYCMKNVEIYCIESKKDQTRYIVHYDPFKNKIEWNKSELFSDPIIWHIYTDQKDIIKLSFEKWFKKIIKKYV